MIVVGFSCHLDIGHLRPVAASLRQPRFHYTITLIRVKTKEQGVETLTMATESLSGIIRRRGLKEWEIKNNGLGCQLT